MPTLYEVVILSDAHISSHINPTANTDQVRADQLPEQPQKTQPMPAASPLPTHPTTRKKQFGIIVLV
ncbi:MAG: hypothetical protein ABIQ44_02100 [Chloroflexia bacterium]